MKTESGRTAVANGKVKAVHVNCAQSKVVKHKIMCRTRPLVLSPSSDLSATPRLAPRSNVRKTWWNVRSKRREESLESI